MNRAYWRSGVWLVGALALGCGSKSDSNGARIACEDAVLSPVTHTATGVGPAFLGDDDSDGNGLLDREEWGMLEISPLDTDDDGEPDYLDVDDDDDGLVDRFDADRLSPLSEAESQGLGAAFGVLLRARVELADGAEVYGAARPGDRLVIEGTGLSCDARVAFVADAKTRDPDDGAAFLGADTQTLVPVAASDTELEVEVPAGVGGRVRVILGQQRSGDLALESLAASAPLLAVPEEFSADVGAVLTLRGADLGAVDAVRFGDTSVSPATVSANAVTVSVPAGATADRVAVLAGPTLSNEVDLRITTPARAAVPNPRGATRLVQDLEEPADASAIGADGSGDIHAAALGPRLVEAVRDDGVLVYAALVMPGASQVTVDAASSARSLAITASGAARRIAPGSLAAVDQLAAGLSEVGALATLLDAAIGADPAAAWTHPSTEVVTAIVAAADALQAAVDQAVTAGDLALRPEFEPLAVAGDVPQATIDPSGPQDDVRVIQNPGTANIRVINDSQLNMSVRIRDTDRQVDLVQHAQRGYGANVVGSQGPVSTLFSSKDASFDQPRGRDALVEIITAGALGDRPGTPSGKATHAALQLRTVVEKILWPAITTVVDVKINPRLLVEVIKSQLPGAVGDFTDNLNEGQVGAGIKTLVGAVKRDFQEIGPVTQALLGVAVRRLGPEVIAAAAKRLGRNLVPVLNAVETVVSGASLASSSLDAVKAAVDIASTRAVLEWSVLFDLGITRVHPQTITKRDVDVGNIELFGAGFYPKRDMNGQLVIPTITFTDRDPTGFGVFANDRSNNDFFISADGTHIRMIELPAGYVREAVGPIKVDIALAGDSATSPQDIAVETDFELLTLSPQVGSAGDRLNATGRGFAANVEFQFRERNPPMGAIPRTFTAVVENPTATTATIVVPNLPTESRQWYVHAWQGPGFGLRSNGLDFSLPGGAYSLVIFGPEGSVSMDINDSNQIAGTVGNNLDVFVRTEANGLVMQPHTDGVGGVLRTTGPLSISNSGALAGFFPGMTAPTGHLYSGGTVTAFQAATPLVAGHVCAISAVHAISGARAVGHVTCGPPGFSGTVYASTWDPHQYLDSSFAMGKHTEGLDINDAGVAVGCAQFNAGNVLSAPAVFSGGATELSTPQTYADACALKINNSGAIVGFGSTGVTQTALYWPNAGAAVVTIPAPVVVIFDINDSGVMLGASALGSRDNPGVGTVYLSEDAGANWSPITGNYTVGASTYNVVEARAISNDGTIAVSAKLVGGFNNTFAGALVPAP